MFKLKKDSQIQDSEVPFWREKRYYFRYHLGQKGIIFTAFVNKNVPFLNKNGLKRYLYFFKKVPTGTYKSPDETHIDIYGYSVWYILIWKKLKNTFGTPSHPIHPSHPSHQSINKTFSKEEKVTVVEWFWKCQNRFLTQTRAVALVV